MLLKDFLNLFIDTDIPFEKQGLVKVLGLFLGYLTSERIEMSIAFSKWLGVSAIAYVILGTGNLLIIFLIAEFNVDSLAKWLLEFLGS